MYWALSAYKILSLENINLELIDGQILFAKLHTLKIRSDQYKEGEKK